MDSLQLLRLSEKGGDRFEWIADVQELDKFFAALRQMAREIPTSLQTKTSPALGMQAKNPF